MDKNTKIAVFVGVGLISAVGVYLLLKKKNTTTVQASTSVVNPVTPVNNSQAATNQNKIIAAIEGIIGSIFGSKSSTATTTPSSTVPSTASTSTAKPSTGGESDWVSIMTPVYDDAGNNVEAANFVGFSAN